MIKMKTRLLIAATLLMMGCHSTKYIYSDFSRGTYICNTFLGQFPVQNIIQFNDSTYSYTFTGGRIYGEGAWRIVEGNKSLILTGKEFPNIRPSLKEGINTRLVLKIVNKNKLLYGDDIYKRK